MMLRIIMLMGVTSWPKKGFAFILFVLALGFSPVAGQTLKERMVFPKPDKTILTDKVQDNVIVVKFREGTRVRARSGRLLADIGHRAPNEEQLLRRNNLDHTKVAQELSLVNSLFQGHAGLSFERLFTRPEEGLDLEKQRGELNATEELADLNLYYRLLLDKANPETTEQLIDQLNALDIVEIAYAAPIPEPAQAGAPAAATPDFTNSQGYLNAAPQGIDARYAWLFPGGKGNGVRVIDIETGWVLNHEDLPATFYSSGQIGTDQHGTAVLGAIAGVENGYGITGIAPQSSLGVASRIPDGIADAINQAAMALSVGDIILIEQHARGPSSGLACTCNCSQFEYVAMEYWPDSFDAIANATAARGVVVVEAAGNGSMDLDSPIYQGRFNRGVRDSGAILVGAGQSPSMASPRGPECWTNSGSIVDVQGWGDSVVTTGYGDLFGMSQGLGPTRWYTNTFSGTSSASPIVVGAAADVQGIRIAAGLTRLHSRRMRNLLRVTGTPQAASPRQIGPLPNLREATVIRVDRSFGGTQLGTPAEPFRTVTAAHSAAWPNARVKIRPGSYPETPTFNRPMTLSADGGTVTIGQ